MKVWINGEMYERDQAKISVFDAGFQHGVGLFETMQARGNKVFRLDDHLRRLHDSARDLGLTERLQEAPLSEAVQRTVEEARTSHLFDPKVGRQVRMDEAKFEKDHPDYLTGNE